MKKLGKKPIVSHTLHPLASAVLADISFFWKYAANTARKPGRIKNINIGLTLRINSKIMIMMARMRVSQEYTSVIPCTSGVSFPTTRTTHPTKIAGINDITDQKVVSSTPDSHECIYIRDMSAPENEKSPAASILSNL